MEMSSFSLGSKEKSKSKNTSRKKDLGKTSQTFLTLAKKVCVGGKNAFRKKKSRNGERIERPIKKLALEKCATSAPR